VQSAIFAAAFNTDYRGSQGVSIQCAHGPMLEQPGEWDAHSFSMSGDAVLLDRRKTQKRASTARSTALSNCTLPFVFNKTPMGVGIRLRDVS
jgi:hypothetical protein